MENNNSSYIYREKDKLIHKVLRYIISYLAPSFTYPFDRATLKKLIGEEASKKFSIK